MTRFRSVRFMVTVAAVEMLLGLAVHAFPREFAAPVYDAIRPFFPLLSAALVAGGVGLLLGVRYDMAGWGLQAIVLLAAAPLAGPGQE